MSHIYPSPLHSSRMRSCCIMAASAQSLMQVALVGGREDIPPVEMVGLGVTKAAFDVFSNFVEHIAANVGNTSGRTENLVATRSQLRRSARFATCVSAPNPCPVTLPIPLKAKVRAVVCTPSVIAKNQGLGASHSYRCNLAPQSWVPPARAWAPLMAIISWLLDVHAQPAHVDPNVVRGEECGCH